MIRLQFKTRRWTSALALALALGGCASAPPPDGAMNQAQAMLNDARQAGAADYAPVDLSEAQTRFQQAQAAIADHKYDVAADLADEASTAAQLARGKALLAAARAQIQSKTEANDQLRAQAEATPTTPESNTSVAPSDTTTLPPTELPEPAQPAASDSTAPKQALPGEPSSSSSSNQGGQP